MVRFRNITFQNRNSIAVTFKIEAPVGKEVSKVTVKGDSTGTANPNVDDCKSVRLISDDGTHQGTQIFALSNDGEGRPIYLETVSVIYTVGDFRATVQSRTSE